MTVFLTGFPGFLGSALVRRLLAGTDETVACLVQPRYHDLAVERARELAAATDEPRRIELYDGDVTDPDLGLGAARSRLARETTAVFHLAAVYDLGVDRDLAQRVNVDGTRHVLDFADECRRLERFHHVSTCYVSGRYDGTFRESDLREGQRFNNWYEASKFRAEVAVRDRTADGLPATTYRPAIAVGDSETGRTQKYDGPYAILRLLDRQPRVAVLPVVGDPAETRLTVVPRDFVVDAIDHLRDHEGAVGTTYQLADPDPPTIAAALDAFGDALDTSVVRVRVPKSLLRRTLSVGPVRRMTGVDPALVDYFDHPTTYDTTNLRRDLPADLLPPSLPAYLDALVAFMRANPDVDASGLQ